MNRGWFFKCQVCGDELHPISLSQTGFDEFCLLHRSCGGGGLSVVVLNEPDETKGIGGTDGQA